MNERLSPALSAPLWHTVSVAGGAKVVVVPRQPEVAATATATAAAAATTKNREAIAEDIAEYIPEDMALNVNRCARFGSCRSRPARGGRGSNPFPYFGQ